jgi:hypothetical protein
MFFSLLLIICLAPGMNSAEQKMDATKMVKEKRIVSVENFCILI